MARTGWDDVAEGVVGAAGMVLAFLTPMLRRYRSHWGTDEEAAARSWPGDTLVPHPTWSWTHAVTIEAPAEEVWPWVAQIGQGKAGFYSYAALENLVGCVVENAPVVHPEWTDVRVGDAFRLHPDMPAMTVAEVTPGRAFVAHGPSDGHMAVSWLFLVEPLGIGRCRFVSRFRTWCTDDLATRAAMGPTLMEPVGFVMDRRMLLGVKERAERPQEPPDVPTPEAFWETAPAAPRVFERGLLAALPEAARRWLGAALSPGAPLSTAVRLQMVGEIRLGEAWSPFEATEVIRWDRGFVWRARVRMGGLPVSGADAWVDGVGSMRWRLLGLLPVARGAGPDVDRSAAGRLHAEAMWLPGVLLDGAWEDLGPERCAVTIAGHGLRSRLELEVDAAGGLTGVTLSRWGDTGDGAYAEERFGARCAGGRAFGGVVLPERYEVGWFAGTPRFEREGVFFRGRIEAVDWR